jgi:hypothetical protein
MSEKEIKEYSAPDSDRDLALREGSVSVAETPKSRWERSWPVIACGSGMCSTDLTFKFTDTYSRSLLRWVLPGSDWARQYHAQDSLQG